MTEARTTKLFVEQKSPPLGDLGGQEIWRQKRKADEKTRPLQEGFEKHIILNK